MYCVTVCIKLSREFLQYNYTACKRFLCKILWVRIFVLQGRQSEKNIFAIKSRRFKRSLVYGTLAYVVYCTIRTWGS